MVCEAAVKAERSEFIVSLDGCLANRNIVILSKSWPDSAQALLHEGKRHRLVFDNRSQDDHPIHLHRHNFELVSITGKPTSGIFKDVVMVEAGTRVEADLVANNPGDTLFHCHQQDHMDSGFMALFRYDRG